MRHQKMKTIRRLQIKTRGMYITLGIFPTTSPGNMSKIVDANMIATNTSLCRRLYVSIIF